MKAMEEMEALCPRRLMVWGCVVCVADDVEIGVGACWRVVFVDVGFEVAWGEVSLCGAVALAA